LSEQEILISGNHSHNLKIWVKQLIKHKKKATHNIHFAIEWEFASKTPTQPLQFFIKRMRMHQLLERRNTHVPKKLRQRNSKSNNYHLRAVDDNCPATGICKNETIMRKQQIELQQQMKELRIRLHTNEIKDERITDSMVPMKVLNGFIMSSYQHEFV